ncbi:hypothetical protein ACIOHC_10950 [Streptomyces sp. NPDC088252]|uniref:phage tail protein n=1 Tax=unclassified Streptomyces TaxID=2593676 RepID=UPI003810C38A
MGEDEDYGSARIRIVLDDSGAVADARDLGIRIQRALDRATRGLGAEIRRNIQHGLDAAAVTVRVEPDLDRFHARIRDELHSTASLSIPVTPDLTGFMERVRAMLAGEEVPVRVVPDFGDFDARVRAHRAPDVTVHVNTDVDSDRFARALSGLGGVAGRVGGALTGLLKLGAIGIAAASAAQSVGGLVAALAPAAGIVAAFPAAIAGGVVAINTLKLALLGVGDALGAAFSGDAEKFQEALDALAPAAQKAVLAVKELAPDLKAVQQAVQQSFFKQFAGDVSGAVTNLLPLRTGLQGVAAEFGKAASEGLKFAASGQALAPLQAIIKGTQSAASGLQVAIAPIAKGFLDIAAAVLTAFGPGLGASIGQAGAQLGTWLSTLAASGKAVEAVSGAVAVFKQLGAIAANVGSIISGMFRAADGAGGGLLNNLQTITGSFREFVNSAKGQEAIGNVFGTVASIAAQLGPILSALVTQIGAIAPALAPVFVALGPALVGLINALGPALAAIGPSLAGVGTALADTFATLGPALGPVGAAVGSIITALTPLLPLVGQIAAVLLGALAPAFQQLATALGPLISQLAGALAPVITQLGSLLSAVLGAALQAVIPLLGPLVGLVSSLLAAVSPLIPVLTQVAAALGAALGSAAQALAPLLASVGQAATTLVAALAPLVGQILTALLPILPPIIDAFNALVAALVPLLPPIAELVAALVPIVSLLVSLAAPILKIAASFASWLIIKTVVPVLTLVVTALTGLASALTSVITFITNLPSLIMSGLSALGAMVATAFNGIVTFFTGLPGLILSALQALPGLLSSFFQSALTGLGTVIGTAIGVVILLFQRAPGMILNALSSLGSTLAGVFTSAWNSAKSAVSAGISAVISFLAQLPGRAASAISSMPGRIASVMRSAGSSALGAARSFGTQLVSFFTGLPGRIRGALSGAASALVGAGRQLVQGLINGVKAMAGQVASAAKSVVSSAIKAAKDVLKIHSPSRVFVEIGKNTGKGFIVGLTGTASQIKQTTDKIAREITQAFKGQNTRVDDRLVTMVKDGNAKLQKLATQRDKLAQRIADAQKFATDTKNAALSAFSLQNLTQGAENLTGASIINGLKDAVAQVKAFSSQIDTLRKKGLRKDLLEQVIQMGPQAGAEIARTLSRQSAASLKEINQLQGQLVGASDQLGKLAANALYDAGKEAGRGLLAGLKGQKKDIEQLMLDIAKGMQRSIRTALRIKSPSRVFAEIGDQTGAGLQVGLTNRISVLEKAARAAARAVVDTVSGQFAVLPGRIGSSLSGISDVRTPVIAPLTRSQRLRQQAEQGGLMASVVAPRNAAPQPAPVQAAGASITNHWTIHEAGDAHMTARRVLTRMTLAAGVV